MDAESVVNPRVIQPAETAQSVQLSISDWQNWHRISEPTSVVAANIPQKADSFQTWIELTPEMTPAWRMYAPIGLSSLPEMGVGTVLLSPQWFISSEDSLLHSTIGATPFKTDLVFIIDGVNALGMDSGLFPRLGPADKIQTLWTSQVHSETWWQDWFTSYRFFILNYAQIAAETQAEWFVIGGKDVMPAFPGGVYADSSASDVPESFGDQWLQLISEIRSFYTGKLVWATNAQVSMDPLPHFVNMFDGLYITVDSPLATTVDPSLDELSFNFEAVINSQVYEVFQSTQKPIIIGLAYPSVESSYSGCTLIDQNCSNDGIFIFDEIADRAINLDEQVAIYNATLPVLAAQDWIDGIAIRGYDPILVKLDGSSSIAGKPAMDVIWYWFSGLAPD